MDAEGVPLNPRGNDDGDDQGNTEYRTKIAPIDTFATSVWHAFRCNWKDWDGYSAVMFIEKLLAKVCYSMILFLMAQILVDGGFWGAASLIPAPKVVTIWRSCIILHGVRIASLILRPFLERVSSSFKEWVYNELYLVGKEVIDHPQWESVPIELDPEDEDEDESGDEFSPDLDIRTPT